MLTYVIRRLLYSVVVLVAGELPRLHVRHGLRRPARAAADHPERLRAVTVQNVDRAQAPRRPDPRPVLATGSQDAVTNQFGTTLLDNRPILPDLWRVMKNTLQLVLVAELLAILVAVVIGVYSAMTPVLGLRLHGDDVQLPRSRDAGLLAGADVAGPGRADLRADRAPNLPDREPELGRSRKRDPLRASTGPTTSCCPSSC